MLFQSDLRKENQALTGRGPNDKTQVAFSLSYKMLLPPTPPNKVARNPFRFGMAVGFLVVPLVWMAGEALFRAALGWTPLHIEAFWEYVATGAPVGAVLGGNIARILMVWLEGKVAEARGIALVTGAVGVGFYALWCALFAATTPFFLSDFGRRLIAFIIERNLPFLLCLLLLFIGLFGPRK